jgi:membrane associated rhomboid family serine protease
LIPLRDLNPSQRFPIVNYTIMILCGLGFFTELSAGAGLEDLFSVHGLVPARFLALADRSGLLDPALYVPLITSTFLHAGLLHFLGNMLFLWIFGDNVEDRMGHLGYALFYVTGGVAAGLAHVVANPESTLPTVGASGSIAAVMGAYLLLYPRAKVVSLVVVFFFIRIVSVPAVIYLAVWFGFQILSGSVAQATAPGQGGVAWWAHAGGFAFGVATVALLGLRAWPTRKGR